MEPESSCHGLGGGATRFPGNEHRCLPFAASSQPIGPRVGGVVLAVGLTAVRSWSRGEDRRLANDFHQPQYFPFVRSYWEPAL
ncbi:hypothetical protein scyTo_0021411 [Scyliorhinus torazame]|uniref:Uncharacterized protein n=1 Tax=Scyliorhinus torazame TaxID=75743 RepID=A0A401Q821_SCYTO|nr:hypothetical protein [Scyliorhinus torazame]